MKKALSSVQLPSNGNRRAGNVITKIQRQFSEPGGFSGELLPEYTNRPAFRPVGEVDPVSGKPRIIKNIIDPNDMVYADADGELRKAGIGQAASAGRQRGGQIASMIMQPGGQQMVSDVSNVPAAAGQKVAQGGDVAAQKVAQATSSAQQAPSSLAPKNPPRPAPSKPTPAPPPPQAPPPTQPTTQPATQPNTAKATPGEGIGGSQPGLASRLTATQARNVEDGVGLQVNGVPTRKAKPRPVESPRDPVHEYAHRHKHGEPLSNTGKPPVSREQAIAIGMSKKERGDTVHVGPKEAEKVRDMSPSQRRKWREGAKKAVGIMVNGVPYEGVYKAGGPFIGPRGGKYADPQLTKPWKEGGGGGSSHPAGRDEKLKASHDKRIKQISDQTHTEHQRLADSHASKLNRGKPKEQHVRASYDSPGKIKVTYPKGHPDHPDGHSTTMHVPHLAEKYERRVNKETRATKRQSESNLSSGQTGSGWTGVRRRVQSFFGKGTLTIDGEAQEGDVTIEHMSDEAQKAILDADKTETTEKKFGNWAAPMKAFSDKLEKMEVYFSQGAQDGPSGDDVEKKFGNWAAPAKSANDGEEVEKKFGNWAAPAKSISSVEELEETAKKFGNWAAPMKSTNDGEDVEKSLGLMNFATPRRFYDSPDHCCSLFIGSPYYARALENRAKMIRLEAKACDIDGAYAVSTMSMPAEDRKKLENLAKEMIQVQKERKLIEAEYVTWKAKDTRKNDPMQKSFFAAMDMAFQDAMVPFEGVSGGLPEDDRLAKAEGQVTGKHGDQGYYRQVPSGGGGSPQFFEGEPGNSRLASPNARKEGLHAIPDLQSTGDARKKDQPQKDGDGGSGGFQKHTAESLRKDPIGGLDRMEELIQNARNSGAPDSTQEAFRGVYDAGLKAIRNAAFDQDWEGMANAINLVEEAAEKVMSAGKGGSSKESGGEAGEGFDGGSKIPPPPGESEGSGDSEKPKPESGGKEKSDPGKFHGGTDPEHIQSHVNKIGEALEGMGDDPQANMVRKLIANSFEQGQEKVEAAMKKHGLDPYTTDPKDTPPEVVGIIAEIANQAHEQVSHLQRHGRLKHPGPASEGMSSQDVMDHMDKVAMHYTGKEKDELHYGSGPYHDAFQEVTSEIGSRMNSGENIPAHEMMNMVDAAFHKVKHGTEKSMRKAERQGKPDYYREIKGRPVGFYGEEGSGTSASPMPDWLHEKIHGPAHEVKKRTKYQHDVHVDGEHVGTVAFRTKGGKKYSGAHHAVTVDGEVHEFPSKAGGRKAAAKFAARAHKKGKKVKKGIDQDFC